MGQNHLVVKTGSLELGFYQNHPVITSSRCSSNPWSDGTGTYRAEQKQDPRVHGNRTSRQPRPPCHTYRCMGHLLRPDVKRRKNPNLVHGLVASVVAS